MVENQNTSNLELPYIIASQAQKHVTHNEALKKLDAIVQLSVISRTTIPETEPLAEGSRFIIPDGAEGIFSGMDGKIAISSNQSWEFYTPNEGWLCFVQDEGNLWIHTSNNWREANQVSAPDFVSKLGINATPDDQNRLSVNADATLLNNDGNGHQLKVNKSIETDTASCVFSNRVFRTSRTWLSSI